MRSKVSIVIPTINRTAFMCRAIEWCAEIGIPVFVGDSSGEPAFYGVQRLSYIIRDNLTYQHYIDRANEMNASWKVAQKVTTPYIAWCGDDDFFMPAFLKEGCRVLDEQPRTTSVLGYAVLFATKKNGVWNPIESVTPYPGDAFFRLYRTEILKEAWEEVKDIEDAPPSSMNGYIQSGHIEGCDLRGRALMDSLKRLDPNRARIPTLSVMRQVHPLRVCASPVEPLRSRLGHYFPRAQYAHQWLRSWREPLSLPALRRQSSPHFGDFWEVELFLARH